MLEDIIDAQETCAIMRALSTEEKLRLSAPVAELVYCNHKSFKEGFLFLEERINDIAVAGTFSSVEAKQFYFTCLRLLLSGYNTEDTHRMLMHFYYSSLPAGEEGYARAELSLIVLAMGVICSNSCRDENQFATYLLSFLGNDVYEELVKKLNVLLEPKALHLTSLHADVFGAD